MGAAGDLTEPGNSKSLTTSNESLDQAQHDPMDSLGELEKARRGRDRSTLTMPTTWQHPIAITALLGVGLILLNWLAYFIYGFPHSFVLAVFITLLVALFVVIMLLSEEIPSLDSLLSLGHVTGIPWDVVSFAVIMIAMVCILKPPTSIFFFVSSTALGVGSLALVLEMRRSVHLRLLWYNTTGKSLRPCNMLKAQYYSQNLRGALFISKDAPDGCWSYHPNFSLTGQRREIDKDLQDEFEVSGYTYKCRYQYPTSFLEVTMRGKSIKSMETPLEPEVHDMFIRLIRRWKHKAEDGVFYGMQRIWGVNVTHCLEVEELYKLLVEGHIPVQYVNGPYTKALVMGEREILENIIKVIIIIVGFFGVMYYNYGGHMVLNVMALILSLIIGGMSIRGLHLSTYADVESKIFSYKYLYWFKYWEYRGQVLCPDRYCMEVMGHPVHVEGGTQYAELTNFGDPISDSMFTSIPSVPVYRIEIGKCTCMLVRDIYEPDLVKFYIQSTEHHSGQYFYKDLFYKDRIYKDRMSKTCERRFQALLTWWGEGEISFVSSKVINEGKRIAHCTSLLDIFLWFVGGPYRSLDGNSDCHTFRFHKLGYGFENGLWLVHHDG